MQSGGGEEGSPNGAWVRVAHLPATSLQALLVPSPYRGGGGPWPFLHLVAVGSPGQGGLSLGISRGCRAETLGPSFV